MSNPLICERCSGDLEADDAVSIIQGICGCCRRGEPRPARNYVPETERVIDHAAVAERFQPAISRPEPADILAEPLVSQPESPYVLSDGEEDPPGPSRRRRDLAIGTAVGLILTACVAGYLKFGSSERSDEPRTDVGFPVTLAVTPPSASVSL
ncbi:MAG: hypothetical protein O7B26_03945, partial [Planctomycetota bacterium]|nr:hypothetical protein [Planctomycetota bacterium]